MSNQELWIKIKGEDHYFVSNKGNIMSYFRGSKKKLKLILTVYGYHKVALGRGKQRLVHRLVAEAFISNPNRFEVVNHKDTNKVNNSVENLEWCTQKYNMQHGWDNGCFKKVGRFNKKVTDSEVKKIRDMYKVHGITQAKISKIYGLNQSEISRIINHKSRKHVL